MLSTANGTTIGYDDIGSGLPVVFLHGYPHDRSLWASQLGALAVPARTGLSLKTWTYMPTSADPFTTTITLVGGRVTEIDRVRKF